MAPRKRKSWTIYRSAVTGRFVSKAYAEAHPDTTVAHTIRPDAEIAAHQDQPH